MELLHQLFWFVDLRQLYFVHEHSRLLMPMQIDYTHVSGRKWDEMDADEFIVMMSDEGFLGDPLLKTQVRSLFCINS